MTPKARKSLRWFAEHGPVGWFNAEAPTFAMRQSLVRRGLIRQLPAKDFQVIKYEISEAGRQALADIKSEDKNV